MMERPHRVVISVGSNMGDRLANCRRGIEALAAGGDTLLLRSSRFYQTEPVGYTDQEWFVNAVVEVETTLRPLPLLKKLQAIQRQAGRLHDPIRFGPRILDLDILFFDALVLDTPELTIPHPRLHERRFVLQPICDIDTAIHHPVLNRNAAQLLSDLDDAGQEMIALPCDS